MKVTLSAFRQDRTLAPPDVARHILDGQKNCHWSIRGIQVRPACRQNIKGPVPWRRRCCYSRSFSDIRKKTWWHESGSEDEGQWPDLLSTCRLSTDAHPTRRSQESQNRCGLRYVSRRFDQERRDIEQEYVSNHGAMSPDPAMKNHRIDVVFATYREDSIKNAGISNRNMSQIMVLCHRIQQWRTFLSSSANKGNLIRFLVVEWGHTRRGTS